MYNIFKYIILKFTIISNNPNFKSFSNAFSKFEFSKLLFSKLQFVKLVFLQEIEHKSAPNKLAFWILQSSKSCKLPA